MQQQQAAEQMILQQQQQELAAQQQAQEIMAADSANVNGSGGRAPLTAQERKRLTQKAWRESEKGRQWMKAYRSSDSAKEKDNARKRQKRGVTRVQVQRDRRLIALGGKHHLP